MNERLVVIVSLPQERLHELEFVRPLERVVKGLGARYRYETVRAAGFDPDTLRCADAVIISGTALFDHHYIEEAILARFEWLQRTDTPVLGICAGYQLIGLVHGLRLIDAVGIGMNEVHFTRPFLGLDGDCAVYELHARALDLSLGNAGEQFAVYAASRVAQAVAHRTRPLFGTLFHPEVRNEVLIRSFVRAALEKGAEMSAADGMECCASD